jgi:hypothetical protein
MKNTLGTKYFSLKLINKDKRIQSIKRSSLKKASLQSDNRGTSKSNDDLLEKEAELLERFEETRLAEEALAQNLKMIKKQKARFLRLQKILSRNVIRMILF